MGLPDRSPRQSLPHRSCDIHVLKTSPSRTDRSESSNAVIPRKSPSISSITREVHEKTTALDKERFEVACLRQDIIDEYEKKSGELLEYLNSMEAAFERQRIQYEQREAVLRRENKELKHELNYGTTLRYKAEQVLFSKERQPNKSWEIERALDILKDESKQNEKNFKKEQKRVQICAVVEGRPQELQGIVDDLQLEIQKKEEMALRRKRRMELTKRRMEEENQELRRKAALGWMLGCLSELYLRLDPEIGTAGIMKLVRKVQREMNSGNHVYSGGLLPPKLEYEMIQKEIRRLISRSQASRTTPLRRAIEACAMIEQGSSKRALDGELPNERRRRLHRSKTLRDHADELRPCNAKPSNLQTERTSPACQQFVVNCVDNRHTPRSCHVTCCQAQDDPSELLKEKKMRGEVVDLKKAQPSHSTWAEIRVLNSEEANHAASRASHLEIKELLNGLESSMGYLLGQERRCRLAERGSAKWY